MHNTATGMRVLRKLEPQSYDLFAVLETRKVALGCILNPLSDVVTTWELPDTVHSSMAKPQHAQQTCLSLAAACTSLKLT